MGVREIYMIVLYEKVREDIHMIVDYHIFHALYFSLFPLILLSHSPFLSLFLTLSFARKHTILYDVAIDTCRAALA